MTGTARVNHSNVISDDIGLAIRPIPIVYIFTIVAT